MKKILVVLVSVGVVLSQSSIPALAQTYPLSSGSDNQGNLLADVANNLASIQDILGQITQILKVISQSQSTKMQLPVPLNVSPRIINNFQSGSALAPSSLNATAELLPSYDGFYRQWKPLKGTIHYTMVNEAVCNGLTNYNYTTSTGRRDSYGIDISSIPDGSFVTSIQINPCASRNAGSSSSTMKVFYRWSGVNGADSVNYNLTGFTPVQLPGKTFANLSLPKNSSSTFEIGAVFASGNKGVRLSRISAIISYSQAAPTVSTSAASGITQSSATLNGTVNPNGSSATGWFRYDIANPGACNDSFGIRVPSSGGTDLGAGTSFNSYANSITGLSPGTIYYYCAIASSLGGTGFGNVVSFTTPAIQSPPSVTTNGAASTTDSSVLLNGSANPNGLTSTGWFRYSTANPGSCNDSFGTRSPASGGMDLGLGTFYTAYSSYVSGLTPGTTYYYCAIAMNSAGTGFGNIVSFTTQSSQLPAAPSNLSATGYTSSTYYYINLAWTDNSTNESGFLVERSTDNLNFAQIASQIANYPSYFDGGLAPGTYYYRVRAYNSAGYSDYSNTASVTVP